MPVSQRFSMCLCLVWGVVPTNGVYLWVGTLHRQILMLSSVLRAVDWIFRRRSHANPRRHLISEKYSVPYSIEWKSDCYVWTSHFLYGAVYRTWMYYQNGIPIKNLNMSKSEYHVFDLTLPQVSGMRPTRIPCHYTLYVLVVCGA